MKFHLVPSVLVLGAAVAAQSVVFSPDSVYSRSEGAGATRLFGAFGSARHQIADANHRGSAMAITELGFRYDHRNYNVQSGMGRTWANVTLHLSECNIASLGPTFSANATSTPDRVFDGPINWPIKVDVPNNLPADWNLAVPFSSSHAYSGTADLLMDFVFTGGKMANNAPWSIGIQHDYALDSFGVGHTALGPMAVFGKVNGGCVDSASGNSVGASLRLTVDTYSSAHPLPSVRNSYHIDTVGSNFGPNIPVLLVLAFGASTTGLPFPGIPCNNIHLGLMRTWFIHPVMANAVGSFPSYSFGVPKGLVPYTNQWHGINLFVQGVWDDSVTSSMKFSAGARNSFLSPPVATAANVRMKTFYDPNPLARVATGMGVGDGTSIPIIRYKN